MPRHEEILDRPMGRRNVPSIAETIMEPLARLRGEMDRLFDDLPARWPSVRFVPPVSMLVPAVEMTETKGTYKVSIEVPGMNAADIEMHVRDGAIFISGEKKERREEEEKGYSYSERSYGSFERRIELPQGSDEKGVKAKIRDGVLEITVPKKPEAEKKQQRIEIETA